MHQYLINKLPIDIIKHIIPYTYSFQNKVLLDDIQDYVDSKKRVKELYHIVWIDYMGELEPDHLNWLINSIFLYANQDYPMFSCTDHLYDMFRRNIQLIFQTDKYIKNYIKKIEKKPLNIQINILWGLLIPFERKSIIDDISNTYRALSN